MVSLLLVATTGCASAGGQYGHHARYAPAVRGYVLSAETGRDDPAPDAPFVLLTNPLTEEKIRCREDVARWLAPHQDEAAARVHDENLAVAGGIALAPLGVAGSYVGVFAHALIATTQIPRYAAGAPSAEDHYRAGVDHAEQTRFDEARISLERALVMAPELGSGSLAWLYLGVSYTALGRVDEARDALLAFVHRAAVIDTDAYRTAEKWLLHLGHPKPARCSSQDPIPVVWSRL